MFRIAKIVGVLALLGMSAGCQSGGGGGDVRSGAGAEGRASESSAAAAATIAPGPIESDTATLYVSGLSCPLCAHNINQQLAKVPGVEEVKVDLGTGAVRVALGGVPRPSGAELADAIRKSGFTLVRIEAGP